MSEKNEQVEPEVAEMHDKIEAAVRKNKATIRKLSNQGAQLDHGELLEERLNVLIEFVLGGADDLQRLEFELRWHEHFAKMLHNIEQQVARAKLRISGQSPNGRGLEIPGRG